MNKKGFFFLVDAILGVAILGLTLSYFYASHTYQQPKEQVYNLLETSSIFLTETKIAKLNNPYKDTLILNGNITHLDNTVIEQINEWEYRTTKGCTFCSNLSENLLFSLLDRLIEHQNIKINLNGNTVYEKSFIGENASGIVFKTRRLVYTLINDSELYGPSYAEISIWI